MIKIDFEKMGGLLPAVIQDADNGQVLMVAFMEEKTLNLTRCLALERRAQHAT